MKNQKVNFLNKYISILWYNVNMSREIKEFFKKYESKIILTAGLILVSVISFEAGIFKGRELKENPIVIEKTVIEKTIEKSDNQTPENAPVAQNSLTIGEKTPASANVQNCAFMGSKNSNKYHLPACRWAKQIKPENTVCFKDENEAKSKGYLPDNNCIK